VSAGGDLPLIVLWEDFLGWLLPVLGSVPKSARFTFATRLQSLALDVLEGLIEARFTRDRLPILRAVNLKLECLRTLLRVAHGQRLLAPAAYRHASEKLDEAGRMLGGWLRDAAGRGGRREARACAGPATSSTA